MAATILDTFNSQREQLSETIGRFYDMDTSLAGRVKPTKVAEVSRYLYRRPFILYPGGAASKVVMDRGVLPGGTSQKQSHFTAGFFDAMLAFEITQEQIDLSERDAQAMIDVFADTMTNAVDGMWRHDNVWLHGDGTGKLSNAASTGTATTLTFAAATDALGVNRLFDGMTVDVWDSAGTTLRADGPYQITAVDYGTKTITFGTGPTAIATTDLVAVANVDAYGPAAPTSFSSTWPGGGTTNAAGLTGDSWMHGLDYSLDATDANYYLGRLKSTIPKLKPIRVNAGSSSLTFEHGELAKNLLIQARGPEVLEGLMCVMHQSLQHHIKNIGTSVTRILQNAGTTNPMTDRMPKGGYNDTFDFSGVPACLSKIMARDRVNYFNPANWGRVEGKPFDFHKVGNTFLFPVYNGDGAQLAALQFWVKGKYDFVDLDPGASAYIDNIAQMSGY